MTYGKRIYSAQNQSGVPRFFELQENSNMCNFLPVIRKKIIWEWCTSSCWKLKFLPTPAWESIITGTFIHSFIYSFIYERKFLFWGCRFCNCTYFWESAMLCTHLIGHVMWQKPRGSAIKEGWLKNVKQWKTIHHSPSLRSSSPATLYD